jgi:hypothetical protein
MRVRAYDAWRESESYQVPMTAEGEALAEKRWHNFNKGFKAGLDEAASHLMELHREAQGEHNLYHVAANKVLELKDE